MNSAGLDRSEAPPDAGLVHEPVLRARVLEALQPEAGSVCVDGTYGRGGHARVLLEAIGDGTLIAADRDPDAIAHAQACWGADPRVQIWQAPLSTLPERLIQAGYAGRVDALLVDLGVSSPQLEDPERGFGFRQDGPLDMRMDPGQEETALSLLQRLDARALQRLIARYGEDRAAGRIARAIVAARDAGTLPGTTRELARLIEETVGRPPARRGPQRHPATLTFQALRIAVNGELDELDRFLAGVIDVLAPGGRLAVISFHSLEDRRVKRALRDASRAGDLPPSVPVAPEGLQPRLRLCGGAIRADDAEIQANPRARSAVLRVAERLT